jgi:ABC-type Zn uptake system ZnuABC Zn-binding protein ZnuA
MAATLSSVTQPIVTYHNSLTHFANHFGLTVSGTFEELGGSAFMGGSIGAAFTEEGFPADEMTAAAEAAGVPVCHLHTDTVPQGMSYVEMMRKNAAAISNCGAE